MNDLTNLPTEDIESELATLAAQIDAATHRMLECIYEIDRRGVWDLQGAKSCAHWIGWRLGIGTGAAREKVRVARALPELPKISEAFRTAQLSYSKVRALTRVATADNEDDFLNLALYSTTAQIERVVGAYRRGDRIEDAQKAQGQLGGRMLTTFWDEDGMLVVQGRLPPEEGAELLTALDRARASVGGPAANPDENKRPVQSAARQADALGVVVRAALSDGLDGDGDAARPEVIVHVDAEVLADPSAPGRACLETGPRVSAETSRRIACDAGLVGMSHGPDGGVLDVGRRTRKISPALRRALRERDGGCAFPGCTNHRWVDAHHIVHWADHGETKLSNLLNLCRGHHRLVHEGGFSIETTGDVFTFRDPDGRVVPPSPEPMLVEDPVEWMTRWCLDHGLPLDDQSAYPRWDGTRYNPNWAANGVRTGDWW